MLFSHTYILPLFISLSLSLYCGTFENKQNPSLTKELYTITKYWCFLRWNLVTIRMKLRASSTAQTFYTANPEHFWNPVLIGQV